MSLSFAVLPPLPVKPIVLSALVVALVVGLPLSTHALPTAKSSQPPNLASIPTLVIHEFSVPNGANMPNVANIANANGVAKAITQPSLYAVMMAEFSADRGNIPQALTIYQQQAFYDDSAPVFERALGLSLQYENAETSLGFANAWQQQNTDHIPALFYVTHLALKAHEYELAGDKLEQILQYDPNADLSQILVGIYPTEASDQAELLATLQSIDTKNNPALLVMKAGLLLQVNQPKEALVEIDKALKKSPKSPAFLTLKADILQGLGDSKAVLNFIEQARKAVPDNQGLFVYQIRYLLKQNQNAEAWQELNAPQNAKFLADDEIKLLAGLVGVDIQRYIDADQWLQQLTNHPNYKDQAYYYLGISAERQLKNNDATRYYGNVMQPDLILQARKRQVALFTAQQRYGEAIASMQKLREQFDEFVPQSYIMQASILNQANQPQQAIDLLNQAQKQLPDNTDILFAKVLLLPDDDWQNKLTLLKQLVRLDPNNVNYQVEYAQVLVNTKQSPQEVTAVLSPLVHDREVGLKARQILAQQALHQQDNAQVISLLADNFDIIPDVISGLLLRQAYTNMGNVDEAKRINKILYSELDYQEPVTVANTNSNANPTTATTVTPVKPSSMQP
ncbi:MULTISPECIES: hypothetical protein [unclassified Moraxella]|uniref:hypothetical protein n=1 Tax=unclassified Moraxella TaxID=2685852 RepID=UPI003AF9DE29